MLSKLNKGAKSMKKSKVIALLLLVSIVFSPMAVRADEWSLDSAVDLVKWTLGLPFKAVGASLASATGVVVGTTAGIIRGAVKGTKAVAGAVGDENGAGETLVGLAVGAGPGAAVHGVVGGLTWGIKGFKAGWDKPFAKGTLVSGLEGIPEAIEWTVDNASKAFSG